MQTTNRAKIIPWSERLTRLPYWLLVAMLLAVLILWGISTDAGYQVIFAAIIGGMVVTIYVTLVAYALALILGLIVALARVSSSRVVREAATFYTEIVRGVPMLVILYYIAFVGAPGLIDLLNQAGAWLMGIGLPARWLVDLSVRDMSFTARAILALTIGYSAFIAEIFRAGIESIDRGQIEAARSLGLSAWQAMRHVVLPQAIRRVLPPLGNDFIAMLKDSSLVSVLGVQDITLLGKTYASSTFRFFDTFNVVAFLYLVMTITLSIAIGWLERRSPTYRDRDQRLR